MHHIKSTSKIHAFFRELSPFSNFHKATFEVNGVSYFCSEQLIQAQKALLFNDVATADKIMLSDSALECKELGKSVRGFKDDVWKEEVEKLCFPSILAKFRDNPCLAEMLFSTKNQSIVEASFDTMWGTGIPLH